MVPPCYFGGALEKVLTTKVVPLPRLTPGEVFASRTNVFLLLLTTFALANPPTSELPLNTAEDVATEEATPPPTVFTQRDLLEEAVALRRIGAFEDAARMLDQARVLRVMWMSRWPTRLVSWRRFEKTGAVRSQRMRP